MGDREHTPVIHVETAADGRVFSMDPGEVAQQLAEQYVATRSVSAVILAGSLGRGRGDEYSDVELDVYWTVSPSEDQRTMPASALNAPIVNYWPYDPKEAEWSEEIALEGIAVTVSGFAVTEIDRWIASLATAQDADLLLQMRMSAIREGTPLYGDEVVDDWRNASTYSRALATATVRSFLAPARLSQWRIRQALVHRRDLATLHRACSDVAEVLLGTLCGLNRIYIEHPEFKWSRQLVGRFTRAPDSFAERLFAALAMDPLEGASRLHELLHETVQLVSVELPEVDISNLEDVLAGRR